MNQRQLVAKVGKIGYLPRKVQNDSNHRSRYFLARKVLYRGRKRYRANRRHALPLDFLDNTIENKQTKEVALYYLLKNRFVNGVVYNYNADRVAKELEIPPHRFRKYISTLRKLGLVVNQNIKRKGKIVKRNLRVIGIYKSGCTKYDKKISAFSSVSTLKLRRTDNLSKIVDMIVGKVVYNLSKYHYDNQNRDEHKEWFSVNKLGIKRRKRESQQFDIREFKISLFEDFKKGDDKFKIWADEKLLPFVRNDREFVPDVNYLDSKHKGKSAILLDSEFCASLRFWSKRLNFSRTKTWNIFNRLIDKKVMKRKRVRVYITDPFLRTEITNSELIQFSDYLKTFFGNAYFYIDKKLGALSADLGCVYQFNDFFIDESGHNYLSKWVWEDAVLLQLRIDKQTSKETASAKELLDW